MGEFASSGVGTAGLTTGVIGTALGAINSGLFGGNGLFGGGANGTYTDALQAKIAELTAEKYSDKVAKEVYVAAAERDKTIGSRFEELAREIADMRVREAQTSGKIDLVAATAQQGIAVNSAAIASLQATVGKITMVGVPNSALVPGVPTVYLTHTAPS